MLILLLLHRRLKRPRALHLQPLLPSPALPLGQPIQPDLSVSLVLSLLECGRPPLELRPLYVD